jgi:D-alanyl-D-alanine carboxypeptidase
MKLKKILVTLSALAVLAAGHAQTFDKAKLDKFFDRLAEKNKAMGSLLISKDGNVVYTRSIGHSQVNGNDKKPITDSTRHRIGSVTKMFTTAMLMQLVDEGKVKLTDNLDKFFPQIPNASKITVAHVLAHGSGIHDVTNDQDFRTRRLTGVTKDEMLNFIAKTKPDFEPGAKYAYSNSGFFVLGMLVEKLTGKPYEEALKERILDKIGLKDTYVGASIDANNNESYSYKYLTKWEKQPETHASILFGSGALVSTPADMAKFIEALFNGKLVSQESLDQITKNKFGIETFTYNGKTYYGHTGGIDGFGAWLVYQPEEKLAVSYAANGKVYPVKELIDGVVNIYAGKNFKIPAFETIEISTEVLDRYVGVYSNPELPVQFTITREGNTLFAQPTNQNTAALEPIAQDKFQVQSAGIEVHFDADKKQMTIIRNGRERVFTKD